MDTTQRFGFQRSVVQGKHWFDRFVVAVIERFAINILIRED